MKDSGALRIGEWLADPADDSLTRGSEKLKLEPRAMRLLLRLAQHPGGVVSQEQLLDDVWQDVVVTPASVYQSISQLRKALGDVDAKPRYIETVARKGYRLIAKVSAPAEAVPPAPKSGRRWYKPVAVACIALITIALILVRAFREPTTAPPSPVIAVLPFDDMTSDRSEQAFCDGLTEELSNWLAQLPTLRVVARTSASKFRGSDQDVRAIGRELGTTHILEGSLRRHGDRYRVTAQLIDSHTGLHEWSRNFDSDVGDVIELQEGIARAVATNLEIRLTPSTDERFKMRRSSSARAHSLYLLAKHHAQQISIEGNKRAISLYKESLSLDPDFAPAQVGLAAAYLNERFLSGMSVEEIASQAQPLLDSAAKGAPELAELYAVRGALQTELRRREAGLADLKHALQLNPNLSKAASELGFYYLTAGMPRESQSYSARAAELDPMNANLHAQSCMALTDLGQFDAAKVECDRARALSPGTMWPEYVTSAMESSRGDIRVALQWIDGALRRDPGVVELEAERGDLLLKLGAPELAAQSVRRAVDRDPQAARESAGLMYVGLQTAVAGGSSMLRKFVADHQLEGSQDPEILFELANAALQVGDFTLARRYSDRALASPTLPPEDLASPWLARTRRSYLLIAATAEQATGAAPVAARRLDELARLLDSMIANGVRRGGVYGLQAQMLALRGDPDGAMRALGNAVGSGWREAWFAEHEPWLAPLRNRPDYRELLSRVNARDSADRSALD